MILGAFVGVARLSTNWLLSRMAAIYIEVLQDIPVLLQFFFWYAVFYEIPPSPRRAIQPMDGIFLSNRGLVFAIPKSRPAHGWMPATLGIEALAIWAIRVWTRKRQARNGIEGRFSNRPLLLGRFRG